MDQSEVEKPIDAQLLRVKKEKRKHTPAQQEAHKNNKWIAHLREYRESNPEFSYKEAMQAARPSWAEKKNVA